MKVKKVHIFAAALTVSTLILALYVCLAVVKSKRRTQPAFSTNVSSIRGILERDDRYVAYSIDRWGPKAISITNNQWLSLVTRPSNFVFRNEANGKFVPSLRGSNELALDDNQMYSLTNELVRFFKAYISGSYSAFREFRECSPFVVNTADFDNDSSFTDWLDSQKYAYSTPEQKLTAIWNFLAQQNALHQWTRQKIRNDLANGSDVSIDTKSSYYKDLLNEFQQAVDAGTVTNRIVYKILAISPNDLFVYVWKSTNSDIQLWNFQNYLVKGMQNGGYNIIKYKHNPETIMASDGTCTYAVVTASVLVDSCDCYVPITVAFYWSPVDNKWLPFKMGRFAMGVYNALF